MNKVEQLQATNQKQSHKMEYYETVLQSETLIPTTVIAKELGTSAVVLNCIPHSKEIIYILGEPLVLYQQYQNKGLTGTKTHI